MIILLIMFTIGALTALSSRNEIENQFKIENKKTFSIDEKKIQYNFVIIDKCGDIYNPKSIIFKKPSQDFNFNNLIIECGGIEILRLDLELCKLFKTNLIEKYTIDETNYIQFNLPWNELNLHNLFKLISLHNEVKIKIDYEGTCDNSKLLGYYTYLENLERIKMVNNISTNIISSLKTTNINHSGGINNYNLYFNGLSNGLFFKDLNFDSITDLKLLLNNNCLIHINKFNIRTFMKKINDNSYYLPFDDNFNYQKTNLETTINLSMIKNIKLEIKGNESNFKVGYRTYNIFKIQRGLGSVLFYSTQQTEGSIQNNN